MTLPSRQEVSLALLGAGRLFRFDATGLACFAMDGGAVGRSFFAAMLCFPAFALQTLLGSATITYAVSDWLYAAIWGLLYVILWVAYPLLAWRLLNNLGMDARWAPYITALNWCSVLSSYLALAGNAMVIADSLPFGIAPVVLLLITLYLLAYEWQVTRVTLRVPGRIAAGLVFLANAITFFLIMLADSMTGAQRLVAQ